MVAQRKFTCAECKYQWEEPYGTGKRGAQMTCPKCGSPNVHRAAGDRGYVRSRSGGLGIGRGPSAEGRGRGGSGRGPRNS